MCSGHTIAVRKTGRETGLPVPCDYTPEECRAAKTPTPKPTHEP